MRFAAALAASLACAFAAAGTADAAPSKREFIRRGDALCTGVLRELVPIRRRAGAASVLPPTQKWAATAAIWTDQVAIHARFTKRFHALGIPAGDTAAARLVSGLDRGLVLARRVRDGFVARDADALAAALPAYVTFTLTLNRRVQAYGFRVCGRA